MDAYVRTFPPQGLAQAGTADGRGHVPTVTAFVDATTTCSSHCVDGGERTVKGGAGAEAGAAAVGSEKKKRGLYGAAVAEKGARLVTLAFEHESGILGPEGVEAVRDLGAHLAAVGPVWTRVFGTAARARAELTRRIEGRLAVACAKGTADRLLAADGDLQTGDNTNSTRGARPSPSAAWRCGGAGQPGVLG